jgi:metal-responsive CopG/Arc/MetJ family transcriptional regulator
MISQMDTIKLQAPRNGGRKKKGRIHANIRLDPETIRQVDELAKTQKVSRSDFVQRMLSEFILNT